MAALSELEGGAEQQPPGKPRRNEEPARSANSFPQSFPLLDRNSSDASSHLTDIAESVHSLAAEQLETLQSMLAAADNQAALAAADETPRSTAELGSEASQAHQIAPVLQVPARASKGVNNEPTGRSGGVTYPNNVQAEENSTIPSSSQQEALHIHASSNEQAGLATAFPSDSSGNACRDIAAQSGCHSADTGAEGGGGQPPAGAEAAAGSHGSGSAESSADEAPEAGDGDAPDCYLSGPSDSKSSGSGLSAHSEPFVPSASSSQQATPRDSGHAAARSSSAGGGLNAHAAAFVPAQSARSGTPSDESSGTPWRPPQLQFGSLPESLQASPLLAAGCAQEFGASSHEGGYQYPDTYAGEAGLWHDWAAGYDGSYESAQYANGEDGHYFQQADGTWVSYWGADIADAPYWQSGYEDEANGGGEDYAGDDSHENGHAAGRGRRLGKVGKRAGERRREGRSAWQAAAVDVLESQFSYSRESLCEMLDLHEGNLEVALDMLAQLEAELDGQLPASGQDAPELNEENFPSLSSSTAAAPTPKAPKGGFAKAVKSAPAAPPDTGRTRAASASNGVKAGTDGRMALTESQAAAVPWRETGEAVSQAYSSARAEARDHARLRNAYFQEATKAYLAGNRALAKELSGKGRDQSELMKAAHVQASQAIYKHRNPGRGGRASGLLDLHGLHVKEAIAVLEGEVAAARRARPKAARGAPQRLSVLVGLGKHTKGSRTPARLPAAVEDWVKASQIAYTSPSPGLLELAI